MDPAVAEPLGEMFRASQLRERQSPLRLDADHLYRMGDYRLLWLLAFDGSDGPDAPRHPLETLLEQIQYRRNLLTGETPRFGDEYGDEHGPYRIDAMSPASFDEIEASAGLAALRAWAASEGASQELAEGEIPSRSADIIDRLVAPTLLRSVHCWKLRDLGEEAWTELNDTFQREIDLELVWFDPVLQELCVIVAYVD